MKAYRFEYVQPKLNTHAEGIVNERKSKTFTNLDNDGNFILERGKFLSEGAVEYGGTKHFRRLVPNSSTFTEHRKVEEPVAIAKPFDRQHYYHPVDLASIGP